MRNEFTELLSSKFKELDDLKQQVVWLESHVWKLDEYIDDADAYERLDTIIIAWKNLPVSLQGENCRFLVNKQDAA